MKSFELKSLFPFLTIILIHIIYISTPSIDFLPYVNQSVSGKFISFLFIIETAGLLFFTGQFLYARYLTISAADIMFALTLAYITINRYLVQDNYSFSIRYLELAGLFMIFIILRSNKSEKVFYLICLAAIIGANVQIIIGNLQLYGFIKSNSSFFKTTGSFFNGGPYAGYLASVFPIALFFHKKNYAELFGPKFKRIIQLIVLFNIAGIFSILPVLMSRASFITIILTVVLVYFNEISIVFQTYIQNKFTRFLFFTVLFASVIFTAFFLVGLKSESSKGRYLILKATTQMVTQRPLFGFGFDRFRSEYMDYQAQYLDHHANPNEAINADNTVYAFNEPLQFIVENGIAGFILISIFLYFLLKGADKGNELVRLSLIGLTSIFIFSLFSYPSEILPIKIIFILYTGILASSYRGKYTIQFTLPRLKNDLFIRSFAIVAVTISFYFIFTASLEIESAFSDWRKANAGYNQKDFSTSKTRFLSSFAVLNKNGEYLTDYGRTLFFLHDYKAGVKILQQARSYIENTVVETALGNCFRALKKYRSAEESYILACKMKPGSYYNKYLLLKLYEESAQTKKAVKIARELLKMKIKVQSEEVNTIRNEAFFFLSQQK